MSFGWSTGDIIVALQLFNKVRIALKDSGGSRTEYQNAIAFIDELSTTLRTLDDIQTTSPHPDLLQDVCSHAKRLRIEVDLFLKTIQDEYGESLGPFSTSGKTRILQNKIRYAISTSKNVQGLRVKIGPELSTLQLKISHHVLLVCANLPSDIERQMNHATKAAFKSFCSNQEIGDILQTVLSLGNKIDTCHEQTSKVLSIIEAVHNKLQAQERGPLIQLESWPESLPFTRDTVAENHNNLKSPLSILQNSQQVVSGLSGILRAAICLLSFSMVALYRKAVFTISKRSTLIPIRPSLQSGIKFIDALGRTSTLPYDCGRSWEIFEKTIHVWFQGCPGEDLVRQGFYCVADARTPSEFFTQESWSCCVKDGMTIQMSVIINNCMECGSRVTSDDVNDYALCSSCNRQHIVVTRDAFLGASSDLFSLGIKQAQNSYLGKTTSFSPQNSIRKQLKHAVFYNPPSYRSYQTTHEDSGPLDFGEIDTDTESHCKCFAMAEETHGELSQCYVCYLIDLEKDLLHVPYLRKNWGCPEPFLTNGFQHWSEFEY
ncbi:uncharacterized protein BDZ83DRAFT_725657 [Colletotrichum acutatum]|uniref:Ubiquitin-like domain-containing protein n=1 Tax=Glomerella acutata TaxID=27357 RepID=A0AAD8XQA4_GLOAC|nr:uncharacterized protein BDZ83DRAFT_725657 [Colletotrichum acutatum]KAK1731580.1 hypothetical protein BDZ83DRAFT_725657 [Colletotrichum acutatum]